MPISRILSLLVLVFLRLALPTGASERPNFLWLIAEDLSPDLGCYGVEEVATPNLDRFADEGMRFTHMFTTAGVCSPSRTALAATRHPPDSIRLTRISGMGVCFNCLTA